MGLAGIFIEHDGGPTGADLIAAVTVIVILGAVALAGWRRRKRSRSKWMGRMLSLEQRATANREQIKRLAAHVERETRIVGEIRHELTGANANSQPHLKIVKG